MLRPLYIRLQRNRLTMRIPQIVFILIRLNRPQFNSLLQISAQIIHQSALFILARSLEHISPERQCFV